jgi:hypothetical protein
VPLWGFTAVIQVDCEMLVLTVRTDPSPRATVMPPLENACNKQGLQLFGDGLLCGGMVMLL